MWIRVSMVMREVVCRGGCGLEKECVCQGGGRIEKIKLWMEPSCIKGRGSCVWPGAGVFLDGTCGGEGRITFGDCSPGGVQG